MPYEKLYISALPSSTRYSKSLMHKDQLSFVTMTPLTDFLLTSSVDGVVKFWKKIAIGIEFVKEFKAHVGEIKSVSVSQDGRSFATAGVDKSVKIFDVVTFGTFVCLRKAFGRLQKLTFMLRSLGNVAVAEYSEIYLLGTPTRGFITFVSSGGRDWSRNKHLRRPRGISIPNRFPLEPTQKPYYSNGIQQCLRLCSFGR